MAVEAIGAAASLGQLLELVLQTVEICHAISCSKKEVSNLKDELMSLACDLNTMSDLLEHAGDVLSVSSSSSLLAYTRLQAAQRDMEGILAALSQQTRHIDQWGRMVWVFYGKQRTKDLYDRLSRIRAAATFTCSLLNVQLTCRLIDPSKSVPVPASMPSNSRPHNSTSQGASKRPSLHTARFEREERLSEVEEISTAQSARCKSRAYANPRLPVRHTVLKPRLNVELATPPTQGRKVHPASGLKSVLAIVGCALHKPVPSSYGCHAMFVRKEAAILRAAKAGDVSRLTYLLSTGRSSANSFTYDGETAMSLAVKSGNVTAVQVLVHYGASVNEVSGLLHVSPLACALRARRYAVVKFLINSGASYRHRDIKGRSPLFYPWVDYRINPSAKDLILLLSERSDFADLHVDVVDNRGWYLAHRVLYFGAADDLDILYECGVDIFAKHSATAGTDQRLDWNVLQFGIYHGLYKAVNVLLPYYKRRFGDVEIRDGTGWTSLHIAVHHKQMLIAEQLLLQGADLRARTDPCEGQDGNYYSYSVPDLANINGPECYAELRKIIKRINDIDIDALDA